MPCQQRNITKLIEDLNRIVDLHNKSQGEGEVNEGANMVGRLNRKLFVTRRNRVPM